jgi:hypothetical protein
MLACVWNSELYAASGTACGTGASWTDLADRDRPLARDDRCLADVVVERRHLGNGGAASDQVISKRSAA